MLSQWEWSCLYKSLRGSIEEFSHFTIYRQHCIFIHVFLCFYPGSNGQVTYGGVTEEGFIINPVTGVITTTKELDKELQDHYTLTGNIISTVTHTLNLCIMSPIASYPSVNFSDISL